MVKAHVSKVSGYWWGYHNKHCSSQYQLTTSYR